MRTWPRIVVVLYTAGILLSLRFTPALVRWSDAHFSAWATRAPLLIALALAGALLVGRLLRTPRPFPLPHLALAGLGAAVFAAWSLSDASPVGRIHIPEYGLLALLATRACDLSAGATWRGGAIAAAIGLLEENLQRFIPGRVFDWVDVTINMSSAIIGALAVAWWRWVGEDAP